ncbi:MAG: hypothetical protein EBU42_09010 [Synechococcus sp.]|nr:hypothetical protein [Synechococcus sp.]
MLTRAGTIALRALVELARSPHSVISGPELAKRQELPEARLEQILLQLMQQHHLKIHQGSDCGPKGSKFLDKLDSGN